MSDDKQTGREAIARALDPAGFDAGYKYRDLCEKRADAAITALRQAGLRIVPEEPTEAMVEAGREHMPAQYRYWCEDGRVRAELMDRSECVSPADPYRAMIRKHEEGE